MENQNIDRIMYKGKELIIIGTAHVSKESALLVKKVIEEELPDSVCIELDEARYKNIENKKSWSDTNLIDVIKSKKSAFMFMNLLLGNYQKKIAEKMEVQTGQEMIEAINSAKEIKANIVLADRNIQTTFMRIWRNHNFFQKLKLIFYLMVSFFDEEEIEESDLNDLMEKDMLSAALSEVSSKFPNVAVPLIQERDQYLAYHIKNAKGNKVVAVVGAAHKQGIIEELNKEQDIVELNKVPDKSLFSKISGWIIPILLIVMILLTFSTNQEAGVDSMISWILWNGSFSALFALLVFAHPFSILTSFIIAPISSLNPLLAAGWFAGFVEAHMRKPKVRDFESLTKDIESFKGVWKNRVTRTLLVVIVVNIGSTIGTFVGGIDVVKNFIESLL